MTDPLVPLDSFNRDVVVAVMGLPALSDSDEAWLDLCVAAVGEYAQRQALANGLTSAQATWAAVLHCMRWYGRRSAVNGPAAFGADAAAQIVQSDPDLKLAYRTTRPKVG